MANVSPPRKQARDQYLLSSLYLTPLTVDQLLKLSRSWPQPFFHWHTLYRRLERLRSAGWLRRWRYAVTIDGASPSYYKLSPKGYREMAEKIRSRPPGKYSFSQITDPWHTYRLSQFIVKTFLAARAFRVTLEECYPDKTIPLEGDGPTLYPDFVFTIRAHNGERFHYCLELDNNTQTIRSMTNLESLEWKIRRYEAYQYAAVDRGHNFRVLFITSGGCTHAKNIAKAAAEILLEPRRELVLCCRIQDYLQAMNPLTQRLFVSNRGQRAAMLPKYDASARTPVVHPTLPLAWCWFAA